VGKLEPLERQADSRKFDRLGFLCYTCLCLLRTDDQVGFMLGDPCPSVLGQGSDGKSSGAFYTDADTGLLLARTSFALKVFDRKEVKGTKSSECSSWEEPKGTWVSCCSPIQRLKEEIKCLVNVQYWHYSWF
jgi:hypothetical protein